MIASRTGTLAEQCRYVAGWTSPADADAAGLDAIARCATCYYVSDGPFIAGAPVCDHPRGRMPTRLGAHCPAYTKEIDDD